MTPLDPQAAAFEAKTVISELLGVENPGWHRYGRGMTGVDRAARHLLAFTLSKRLGMTQRRVADTFGLRNPASIHYLVAAGEARMESKDTLSVLGQDLTFAELTERVAEELKRRGAVVVTEVKA